MFGLTTGVISYNRTIRKRQQIIWNYDRTDPAAVVIHIPHGDGSGDWAEWQLARADLGDANLHPVQTEGADLHLEVIPRGGRLILTLYPYTERPVVVSLPSAEVWEFLRGTHKTVPPCADAGRCVGIARDGCLECTLVGMDLDMAMAQWLADDFPFTS
jgi:hypothetical protein